MARARNLKPSFFTNEVLAEIHPLGRLLFQGLWCVSDREGRLEDRPRKLKAELLPYDECDVDSLLNALQMHGFILRYEANNSRYIQVLNFKKHQNPHMKEAESSIPAPDLRGACTVLAPETPELDGLIPPSLNPLPDCGSSAKPPPSRPGAIAVLLRNLEKTRGKAAKITSSHPQVQKWSEKGVTDDQLAEAYVLAVSDREVAGDDAPINAGFLDVFVDKVLNPPKAKASGPPWWTSDQTIIAKGNELGINPRPGESMNEFKGRIQERIASNTRSGSEVRLQASNP